MMGGEFCGNAARSFGLMLAKRRGMAEGYLDISVSGMQQALKDELAVSINIKIVEPHTIQRSEGKAVRIVDLRNGEEK